ncbi:uncharacterized protein JhI-26 [Euwallacea similis]|uniref:uncharacterized protein JhI-26 n=1 Tax=Euwallacea similis TaxID=1736056 RepID=UPI00344DD45F
MCDSDNQDLNIWIGDFLKQRRFSKYELELMGNSCKGDGYLGEVTFVKVLTGIGREEEKIYNLVIKSSKKSKELRRQTPMKEVFEREMFMYSKVFPAFKSFQLEQNVEHPFMKFAKCYSVFNENEREAIILQNLKYLEYDIHDRKKPQNLEHVLLVFKNYGKFHALSLSLKTLRPQLFAELTKDMSDLLANFIMQAGMIPKMTDDFQQALELLKTEKSYTKLKHFDQELIEKCLHKKTKPSDGVSVILHGDCWNNNMMFCYQKSKKKPSDMMFLDFQLSSLGSPIYDLSYYLYAVADEAVLKYHDLLMQTYHHSFMSSLEELGVESFQITLEDLKRYWREYGCFGLILAPFILKIELSEEDEVADFATSAEAGDIAATFVLELKNKEEYNRRIREVFRHYASVL